jgi:hypothetical protein
MKWEPTEHHEDPTVNALLNIAEGLFLLAERTGDLLYGLKYSNERGMSVAEAIEVSGEKIADAVARLEKDDA